MINIRISNLKKINYKIIEDNSFLYIKKLFIAYENYQFGLSNLIS